MKISKMRYKEFEKRSIIYLTAILFIAVSISGCSKTDNTYYNYENTAGTFSGNAVEYLRSQPGVYDSMLLVIDRLQDMPGILSSENITLFAVTNRSFSLALENINQARKDSLPVMPPVSLSTMDSAVLDTFFCRYVIKNRVPTDSIRSFTDGRFFTSLRYDYDMQMQYSATNASGYQDGGPKAIIFSDPKNSIFTRNWIRVNTITVDIKTSNAVVHLLSPGHDFGFGDEFIRRINKR